MDNETIVIALLSGYVRELKENKDYLETTFKTAESISKLYSLSSIEFLLWVGTNYKQDNGSVIGNFYYERGVDGGKDYSASELWDLYLEEKNNEFLSE